MTLNMKCEIYIIYKRHAICRVLCLKVFNVLGRVIAGRVPAQYVFTYDQLSPPLLHEQPTGVFTFLI